MLLATAVVMFRMQAQLSDNRPIASLMPPGALFYLEAKDFHKLLSEWNGSSEKRKWLASNNHYTLLQSRLLQRLEQAQDEFAAVAKLPINESLAGQLAGSRSGFAFYDLTGVKFVYLTQMPSSQVEQTEFWRGRTNYQSREVAGIPFYLKSDATGKRTVTFAAYKEWLVVATGDDLMADSLVLLSGQTAASLANEHWLSEATSQSQKFGDVRLVYSLDRLLKTPQFRTYWIQRNASELEPFTAGASDLFDLPEGFEEQRVLLRKSEAPRPNPNNSLAELIRYVPPMSSLYRAWSEPTRAQIDSVVQQVIFAEPVTHEIFDAPAPEVETAGGIVGNESDLETMVNAPPFESVRQEATAPIVDALLAMQPTALLHVQTTGILHDQVFVEPDSGLVLVCKQTDGVALERAIARYTHPVQTGDLDRLRVTVDGNTVIITRMNLGKSAQETSLPANVTYVATYSHAIEWPHYKKLFDVVDRSNNQQGFFASNLESLGDTLSRLQRASIQTSDLGATVHETVRYELPKP
jgi:hypothetical protein